MIRYHLDENVDHAIARGLRLRGIDVTTTTDAGLVGASDEQQIQFALGENRVVFTHDDDFLRLHRKGDEHLGIAYCVPGSRTIGEIVTQLRFISDCLEPEDMRNQVEFL